MTLILCIYLFGTVWFFIVVAFPVYCDIEDKVNKAHFGYLLFFALVFLWPIVLLCATYIYLTRREQ